MQSDSVYKADPADMCNFNFKQPREPDPYHIVVMRDGDGKRSKKGKAQYGKVIRHRLAELCSIGALAFYLLARFGITKEYESWDFTKNETWYNVKVLIDPKGGAVKSGE